MSAPPPDVLARTLARHPRPAGGDPMRRVDTPVLSLTGMVLNNRAVSGDSGAGEGAASGGLDKTYATHESHAPEIKQHLSLKKKPEWLRARVPGGAGYTRLKGILSEHRLVTVCEEAGCPNMGECWSRGVATIMILGDTCTRACGFCNVKTGRPAPLDRDEPRRVAEGLRLMWEGAGLRHIVITSVNRDELKDGGAGVWAETIVRAKEACPGMSIEVLIPDFEGNWAALQMVIDARPHIINHNLETVRRMYPAVRPSAKFDRSLELLRRVKEQGLVAKTGIMVGIGEKDEEVLALMEEVQAGTRASRQATSDKRQAAEDERHTVGDRLDDVSERGRAESLVADRLSPVISSCDILTIGQYLQPTRNHLPIHRWVTPAQFAMFKEEGLRRGFKVVESGPLVRSSYHADHQADELTEVGDEREREMRRRMGELLGR